MADIASSLLATLSIFSAGAIVGAGILYGHYIDTDRKKEQEVTQARLDQQLRDQVVNRKKAEEEKEQKLIQLYNTQGYSAALAAIEDEMLRLITERCCDVDPVHLASPISKIRAEALLPAGAISPEMERYKLVLFQKLVDADHRESCNVMRAIGIINNVKPS